MMPLQFKRGAAEPHPDASSARAWADLTSFSPAWQAPDMYQPWFIPMQAGDYSFHTRGEINGEQVDETFTSSSNGFDFVQDRTTLQFPRS